ncbi:ABC transporter ATP-binding protein [Candidatus Bipolaricaulota bacterium]|nr:ABC transporter ATP-binding protein [Candidatus Bipolaricaulota bacterium]
MGAVTVKDLIVIYPGGTKALDGVSFTVPSNSIVGYLGPNGAGKTTTINVLTTAMVPTRGDAWVCGYNVRTQKSEIRKRIAVATQDLFLDPLISPYDNMRFFAAIYGVPRTELERRIRDLLEAFELTAKARTRVLALSGGQWKRVQLAVALLREPEVLFLDEPTLALDPLGKQTLLRYLLNLKDLGVTIFYASNEMEQLERVCDRVLFLWQGKLLAQGIVDEFVKSFGGSEIVTIRYEGTLPEHVLADLQGRDDLQVQTVNPLSWASAKARALLPTVIVTLTEQGVLIQDIDIRKPSLNDAFLALVERSDRGKN